MLPEDGSPGRFAWSNEVELVEKVLTRRDDSIAKKEKYLEKVECP